MARLTVPLLCLALAACPGSPAPRPPSPTAGDPTVAVADPAPAAPVTDPLAEPGPAATTEEIGRAAAGINTFGAAVTRRLFAGRGNKVFAPPSLALVLAMLSSGASGPSRDRLARALAFTLPAERQHRALAALGRRWSRFNKPWLTVTVASALFGNRAVAFRPSLLAGLREVYGAETTMLDFTRPEEAAATVNAWVSERTRGRIRDAASAELFAPDPLPVAVVLANALYFRGRWAEEFYAPATVRRTFWVDGEQEVKVPLMTTEGDYRLARRATYAALELDYQGGPFGMVVLLPHARDGLPAVEQECLARDLAACTAGLRQTYVSLRLPKFRLETDAFSLEPALSALGLAGLFVPQRTVTVPDRASGHAREETANRVGANRAPPLGGEQFAGLVTDGTPVYLRDVVQKVFVEVDEKGTEAAAATMAMGGIGDMPPEPVRFFVDRPFLFLIRDRATGVVLFVGRVTDPR